MVLLPFHIFVLNCLNLSVLEGENFAFIVILIHGKKKIIEKHFFSNEPIIVCLNGITK